MGSIWCAQPDTHRLLAAWPQSDRSSLRPQVRSAGKSSHTGSSRRRTLLAGPLSAGTTASPRPRCRGTLRPMLSLFSRCPHTSRLSSSGAPRVASRRLVSGLLAHLGSDHRGPRHSPASEPDHTPGQVLNAAHFAVPTADLIRVTSVPRSDRRNRLVLAQRLKRHLRLESPRELPTLSLHPGSSSQSRSTP